MIQKTPEEAGKRLKPADYQKEMNVVRLPTQVKRVLVTFYGTLAAVTLGLGVYASGSENKRKLHEWVRAAAPFVGIPFLVDVWSFLLLLKEGTGRQKE